MKKILSTLLLCAGLGQMGFAEPAALKEATQLEDKGQFKQSAKVLRTAIDTQKLSPEEVKTAEFRIDRLHRIQMDYSVSKDQLFKSLKKELKNFNQAEFDKWIKDGWFDVREIDGKQSFIGDSVSNLWFRHPELNARRLHVPDKTVRERKALEAVESIKSAAAAEKTPYVLPKTFRVTMRVTAAADAATNGEVIRSWVPIPRQYPFQDNFKLISSSWPPTSINNSDSPIRAVYFEQPAKKGKTTEFKIEYEFTTHGVHFDLKPEKIQSYDAADETVKTFTKEGPHVVFTPEIKGLSARIIGDETNPMLKAKKIFDWLSDDLHYSYSTEYSTIPNISDYCRSHGYGDCGQQALLFITLCRYNGIPARWQSGWNLFPNDTSNHDWSEIYLAPYGWVPVDQYMGNYAMKYITTLTQAQKTEIRDFYFGGLDQYRMAANSDHNATLVPAKLSPRSDDVDFQRGELEHSGKNLYFDQFSYKLTYKELPSSTLP